MKVTFVTKYTQLKKKLRIIMIANMKRSTEYHGYFFYNSTLL